MLFSEIFNQFLADALLNYYMCTMVLDNEDVYHLSFCLKKKKSYQLDFKAKIRTFSLSLKARAWKHVSTHL